MRKKVLPFILFFLMACGAVFAYTQAGNALISASNLYTALSDGTLIPTNASGCNASGTIVPSLGYINTCVKNLGTCASGQPSTYIPPYSAILACKATPSPTPTPGSTATPVPTATPSPAPTATPIPHTTGLTINDGCIGSTSNYTSIPGYALGPTYQAVGTPSGSSCSSGNQLYNGGAEQVLNHGNPVNVGTIVRVGADLYAGTTTETLGYYACLENTATATGTAVVELINSSGTVIGSHSLSTSGGWNYLTDTVTIPSTGVYYIAALAEESSVPLYYENQNIVHAQPAGCTAKESVNVIAYGYVTYLTVSSS
jgi:hypothetical protein